MTEWDDSVDEANLARFDFGEIPEDHSVMTTWHDDEPLEEVFEFAEFSAMHPSVELEKTYIVHISADARKAEMLRSFGDPRQKSD